jgi:hypothetical protein
MELWDRASRGLDDRFRAARALEQPHVEARRFLVQGTRFPDAKSPTWTILLLLLLLLNTLIYICIKTRPKTKFCLKRPNLILNNFFVGLS